MSSRNIRVVIADDDADIRATLGGIIETEPGMTLVGTAPTGAAVVGICSAERPDVAVIDVGMPGGGAMAARGIRRGSPDTHVIVLSGHGDPATVNAMIEAGANSYLVKSGDLDSILGAIRRAATGQGGTLSTEVTGGVLEELNEQLGVRRRAEERKTRSLQRIRRALRDESQRLTVFQAICDIETGEPTAVEALTRFYGGPRRGPDKWFAEASEVSANCLRDLELACAASAISALDVLRSDLSLSVNLSPSTVGSAAFRRMLRENDATRLIVEITEHAPVKDYSALRGVLAGVREAGARVAIDDAGAGYASLRHILQLEPEIIKLDHALTNGIESDRSQQALAAGLIAFADATDCRIIAEGIETAEQVTALIDLGVKWGQGYYFSRPGPLPPELRRGS